MSALTCALFVVAMVTASNAGLVTLTADQKKAILDSHNLLRAQTANGLTDGQPAAANMLVMEWDDRLMNSANNLVQKCVVGHDTGADRALPGYRNVGQNGAGGHSSNFSSYVQMWFNEYKDYTFSTKACTKECGHYLEVVWAKTMLVGCGASECSDFPYNFVCNYAGRTYDVENPYVRGTSGSQCTGDYTFTQRGLCLRKDQCSGSDCTCTLTDCTNGGTLDSANCVCVCPTGFYGDKCEKRCEDTTSADHAWVCRVQNVCIDFAGYSAPYCPKTCDLCKKTVERDLNVVNADGVRPTVP